MKVPYSSKLQKTVNALLTRRGVTEPEFRQATLTYATRLSEGGETLAVMPNELATYLKKVALYAYKTTDQDVERLVQAGYTEDEIFELTLCTALGASLTRLECGLAALGFENK